MKKNFWISFVAFFLFVVPNIATAAFIDLPDTNGMGYFQDLSTGYYWMDVDNFIDMNYAEVISTLSTTSFHLASDDEILALIASTAPWDKYSADSYNSLYDIMGGFETPYPVGNGAPDLIRRLISGIYEHGWSAPTGPNSLDYYHKGLYNEAILLKNGDFFTNLDGWKDEFWFRLDNKQGNGAWAVSSTYTPPGPGQNTVPEPSTMLFLCSGLIGLFGLRRKFKK